MTKGRHGATQEEPATTRAAALAPLRIVEPTPVDAASADAADAAWMLPDIHRRLCRIEQLLRIVPVLVAQIADPTHLSVEGAARVLGVSVKTIRRRIASGTLTLEVVPGSRRAGVPIDEVYDGRWMPIAVSRKLFEDERRELDELKRRNR